jgi:hypothetical protein
MRAPSGDGPTLVGLHGRLRALPLSPRLGVERSDSCKVGFGPRKGNLAIHLISVLVGYDGLLANLGPHQTGKSCIYVNHLDDIDLEVLARLIRRSVAHVDAVLERTEPCPGCRGCLLPNSVDQADVARTSTWA